MAATTQSTQYAKFDTIGLKKRPDSIYAEGRARFLNDVIETTTDNAATNEIYILRPPKGALIDKARSFVFVETAPASTVTIDIGVASDKDNLCDGLDVTSAGKAFFNTVTGAAGADLVEMTGDDDYLVVTLNTMTTPAAGKLRVSICYYVR